MMNETTTRRQHRQRLQGRVLLFCGLLAVLLGLILFLTLHGQRALQPAVQTNETPPAAADPADPEQLPAGWARISMPDAGLTEGTLALVNRAHGFDPTLPQTVTVYENKTDSYLVKDIYLSVTPETMQALNAWMDAFAAQSGRRDVNIVAGYRSYADQQYLYQNGVETKGQAHADAYIQLPGFSEHHTGLAVDLDTYDLAAGTSGGFDGDGDYAWAVQHAWEYGFVQRYPPQKSDITGISYESWHFRYVGLPHACYMAQNELCLEEYIDLLRSHPFEQTHLSVDCEGKHYEIYYCYGRSIVAPTDRSYSVSGNNVDGYIVTVEG